MYIYIYICVYIYIYIYIHYIHINASVIRHRLKPCDVFNADALNHCRVRRANAFRGPWSKPFPQKQTNN